MWVKYSDGTTEGWFSEQFDGSAGLSIRSTNFPTGVFKTIYCAVASGAEQNNTANIVGHTACNWTSVTCYLHLVGSNRVDWCVYARGLH